MPNWCDNSIQIDGPPDDMRKFLDKVQDPKVVEVGDLQHEEYQIAKNIVPMPEDCENIREWCDDNWGTKWGDCDTMLWQDGDTRIYGQYNTAWGPLSVGFWETVSAEFKSLRIAIGYREEGMQFEGAYSFYGGECYYEKSQDSHILYKEAKEALDKIKVLY
tara:strand:- start:82 stop:564 length:483 start_codon:yes stop_codon:yes gene_type:complete